MLVERILPVALKRLSTIQADAILTEAAKLLSHTHISLVVVCNVNRVMVGVLTKTDIVRQIASCAGSRCMAAASDVMTRDVIYCRPNDTLQDVLSKMKDHMFVHVPVVDQMFKPCGVINARDAFQALLGEAEYDMSLLRDYIMGIGYQ
jgi:CBS domain-containing protein